MQVCKVEELQLTLWTHASLQSGRIACDALNASESAEWMSYIPRPGCMQVCRVGELHSGRSELSALDVCFDQSGRIAEWMS